MAEAKNLVVFFALFPSDWRSPVARMNHNLWEPESPRYFISEGETNMEKKEVSREQVRVIETFTSRPDDWLSTSDVSRHSDVKVGTVTHLVLDFYRLGILERFEAFPGFRYRLSPKAAEPPYFAKLRQAATIMKEGVE